MPEDTKAVHDLQKVLRLEKQILRPVKAIFSKPLRSSEDFHHRRM